jgi:hypothetical protein
VPLSPQDHDFARFIDACTLAFEIAPWMFIARAVGRGEAFAEVAHVPEPSSKADRHARYSAGIRKPAPRVETHSQTQARAEARAWGFTK